MNVGLAFERNAIRHPNEPAIFGPGACSNAALHNRTNRIANHLLALGIERGQRVALLVANRAEVVEVLGGVTKAGLVYVGLNFRLGSAELEQVLENAEPSLLLTDSEHLAEVADLAAAHGVTTIDIDSLQWQAAIDAAAATTPPTLHEVRHDDDFCIVYTSGTTGRPKGVVFDHARALQHATVACLEYEIRRGSRYLVQIPHSSSDNITIVPCLLIGAAIGFRDSRSFEPTAFARMVEQEGVSHSFLVPTQLMRLLDRLPSSSDHQLGGLVTLGYGSSPISPDRLAELVDRFGPIFNQLYGMAEIASIGTILRKEDHVAGLADQPELLASCGQASFAVDVRVVNAEGVDVSPGERGEVVFGGPHVMKGYFRDQERTDQVLIDGWMHSGDIAEVSDDGYIFIVDRAKNLIIRGGLNIAPTEIENVLYRHEAVLEASVVGIPDAEWGEAILAVVAVKAGMEIDAETLRTHCRMSELTSIKVPERIEFMESLPKNAVGKLAKNEIRNLFWGDGRKV